MSRKVIRKIQVNETKWLALVVEENEKVYVNVYHDEECNFGYHEWSVAIAPKINPDIVFEDMIPMWDEMEALQK